MAIGQYAAENGNTRAVKQLKTDFPDFPEGTVCSFKLNYVVKLQEKRTKDDFTAITMIEFKECVRPLSLRKLATLEDCASGTVAGCR